MKRAAGVFGRKVQRGAVLTMVVASAAVSCARIAGIDGTYTLAGSGGQLDESGATGGGAGGVQGKGGTQDGSGATTTGGRVNSSGGKTSSEGGNVAEGGATGTPATGGSGGGASGALTSGGNSAQGGALTSGGSPAQGGALTSGGSGGLLHEGVPTAIGGAGGAQGGGGGGHVVAGSGGAPICDEGAPRCLSSTQSQICQNGAWAKTETCAVLESCTMNQCRCSFTTCGTACTDLSTNASNCGVCGHSCQGGLCSAGHCQPVVLVPGQTSPSAIATDGTTLFWTAARAAGGGLYQYTFATHATAVVDLSTEPPQCGWLTSIIQYGGSLYWNGTYTCSMMLPPPQTINSMIFGSLSNDLHSIVGTTNGLFAYDDDADAIGSSRSGHYQALDVSIAAIAADNTTLYWVEDALGGPPNIKQHDLISDLSSGTTTLVSGLWIRQLAAYASFAYFTTFTSQTDTTGLVYRIPNIPGNSPAPLATAQLNPTDIVADASGVYWINGSAANGQIMRASLTGGDATPIATGQAGPYAITTDANNVYWTNQAGGQIMKVAK